MDPQSKLLYRLTIDGTMDNVDQRITSDLQVSHTGSIRVCGLWSMQCVCGLWLVHAVCGLWSMQCWSVVHAVCGQWNATSRKK